VVDADVRRRSSADGRRRARVEGWEKLPSPSRRTARPDRPRSEYIEESGRSRRRVPHQNVFDKGGEPLPRNSQTARLDFIAFWHKPHYVVVEMARSSCSAPSPARARPGGASTRAGRISTCT
jgi:hypothetical protein